MFITFEGIDFAGKSTQLTLLMQHLDKTNTPYIYTREPGSTPPGQKIRDVLLNMEESATLDVTTQALLFAASYREGIKRTIIPALTAGKVVLSDRTNISSSVYQRTSPHCGYLTELNNQLITPDLVFILLIDYETYTKRAHERGVLNYRDQMTQDEFKFITEGYLDFAKNNPKVVLIDTAKTKAEIHNDIIAIVDDFKG